MVLFGCDKADQVLQRNELIKSLVWNCPRLDERHMDGVGNFFLKNKQSESGEKLPTKSLRCATFPFINRCCQYNTRVFPFVSDNSRS